MKKVATRRAFGATLVALMVAVAALPMVALGNHPGNMNEPSYWEAHYPNAVECYSHSGSHAHGSITNGGTAVTLNPFDPDWPGDRWEALIIKAGNHTYDDPEFGAIVDGNRVIDLPQAGVAYSAPKNAGGQTATVSHWIVCKGETPQTTTTTTEPTTTTTEPTTTTTEPTTTTTEPTTTTTEQSTTTTEQESTTTTEDQSTTTSSTEVTPTTAEQTSTTLGEEVEGETTSTTESDVDEESTSTTDDDDETEGTLPFTGIGTDGIALAALIALAAGAGLILLSRRSAESEIDG